MAGIWDQLVDCICRPPRDVYSPKELLGGNNQTFLVGSMEATRLDYELTNKAGQKMVCSHYLPLDAQAKDGKLPVVVYCHCNSGSRRDAEEAVWHLLPIGVGVVAFDFTGSGLSDGKWVTLGAHEVEDLAVVIKHLREQGTTSSIGLWGRSMGAVTALLYSTMDKDIAGMVLDSPFSRLTDLMLEIVVSQKLPIPKVMLKLALKLMRASVKRKAGADINSVAPLDVVAAALVPAMFGHGEEDSFIDIQHSVKLHEAYNSAATHQVYKNLVRFKGNHNHPRPSFFYSSVCCFFYQQFHLEDVLLTAGNPADTQLLMRHGSLNLSGESPDQVDRANGFVNTPWSFESMQLDDLLPEEAALLMEETANEATAAAASGYGASPAGSPVRGGGSSSSSSSRAAVNGPPLLAYPSELNSPRAGGGSQCSSSREAHAAFSNVQQLSSSRVLGAAPAGSFDYHQGQHRQQQAGSSSRRGRPVLVAGGSSSSSHSKQRHSNAPASVEQMRAQSAADGFEVGSRGRSGTIPLSGAPGEPLGLTASSEMAAAAAADAGGATAAGASTKSGGLCADTAAGSGHSRFSSSSGFKVGSPGPAAMIKRWFRGSGSGTGAAAAGSAVVTAAGVIKGSSSSENSHNATSETTQAHLQHQQQLGVSPSVIPVMLSSKQRQQPQQQSAEAASPAAAQPAAAVGVLDGTWALTVDCENDETDFELAAAFAASLQEQQQLEQDAAAAAAAAADVTIQERQHSRHGPLTPEEEEEMLARAIALSLADVQQQEQQHLMGHAPLLQEQQSEHVAELLLSVGTDKDLGPAGWLLLADLLLEHDNHAAEKSSSGLGDS